MAVKIMYKDNMSARAAQQLRREITSMKALNHPNVLRLKDVHEVREYIWTFFAFDSSGTAREETRSLPTLGCNEHKRVCTLLLSLDRMRVGKHISP